MPRSRHPLVALGAAALLVAAAGASITWILIAGMRPAEPPSSLAAPTVEGPSLLEADASEGAEATWRVRVPAGNSSLRISLDAPLRQAIPCPDPLPADGACALSLRLPTGPEGEGRAMLRIAVPGGGETALQIAWRRRADPLAISWEALSPARPDRLGQGLLWIRNRTDADRHLPALAAPAPLSADPAAGPAPCPDTLPPQGRCARVLSWPGGENGTVRIRISLQGAAPIEAEIRAEGFDPLPRWTPLAPFAADPTLGPARQTLEIANAGRGPLLLAPARVEGHGFAIDASTCPERLPPGLACALSLSFSADGDTLAVGRLRLGPDVAIPLHGTAEGYAPRLAFEGENAATAVAGDAAPTLRIAFRLRNIGTRPSTPVEVRHVGAPLPGGSWAWETTRCPALAPGEACDLLQEATAAEDGATESAAEAPGAAPFPLRWSISNLSASLSIDPPGVLMLLPGQASVVREVRLRNTGNAPARLAAAVEGPGYALEDRDCGALLPPGGACALAVRWTPEGTATRAAGRLRIQDRAVLDLLAVRP